MIERSRTGRLSPAVVFVFAGTLGAVIDPRTHRVPTALAPLLADLRRVDVLEPLVGAVSAFHADVETV
jgi:hypothetical protein